MAVKPGWARKRDRLRRRETAAARARSEEPAVPAESLWKLSPADWRLLIITFAGGLGSLVAAAGIIGGAIALARYQKSTGGLIGLVMVTAVMLLMFPAVVVYMRRPPPEDGWDIRFRRIVIGVVVFSIVFVLLAWIGLAAGIK